ncbi:GIP [Symbiodinium sp. CCMP2592]|nr:GIP [Symbiodinium sp. CCMP2592]
MDGGDAAGEGGGAEVLELDLAPDGEAGGPLQNAAAAGEVRVDEAVLEPAYDGRPGTGLQGEAHGSHGSQGGTVSRDGELVPPSGGQRPVLEVPEPSGAGDPHARNEDATGVVEDVRNRPSRTSSVERRTEDVSTISRSLNYMTGLLSTLVSRMDRVEQWQSASGSLPGQQAHSVDGDTGTPVATTPATATSGRPGGMGWVDSERLSRHLAQLSVGEGGSEMPSAMLSMRPLSSTARILEGTFSSDSSTTAMRRAEEARRGVPGALLGPLALANQPFGVTSEAMEVDSGPAADNVDLTVGLRGSGYFVAASTAGSSHDFVASANVWASEYDLAARNVRASGYDFASRNVGVSEYASFPKFDGFFEELPGGFAFYVKKPEGYGISEYVAGATAIPTTTWEEEETLRLFREAGDLGRYVGSCGREATQGSPVSVSGLLPPSSQPTTSAPCMQLTGQVIGAPSTGLACVRGQWLPYSMVQGQMVVQFEPEGVRNVTAATTVNATTESCSIPPPPPPLPPPGTPRIGTSGGSSSTPGGTPIPPWSPATSAPAPPDHPPATSMAASANDAGLSEEPSKLVTKLPSLASARGGDAAVIAGDWLAQLEPSMSSLSTSAVLWWKQLMERVKGLYSTWLESAPVTRLSLRQSVLSQRPAQDRYQRVEQRAAVLLLESLPEELRHEVVSVRAVTVEAMIFLVHCAYQPGGAGEKAHLLQFLTSPEVGSGLEGTLQLARKWVRLLRRGTELQLVLPDPQLDFKATLRDAEDFAYLVVGELEAALLAQPLPAPPKVARMEEGKGSDDGPKGKGKGKQQKPCWAWQDGSGCKFGSRCMFQHAALGPGRCWECGAEGHLKPQCPILGQGGNASGGGGGVGNQNSSSQSGQASGKGTGGAASGAPSSSAATSGSANAEEKPRKNKKKGGGKDKGAKQDAVRKAEEEAGTEDQNRSAAAPPVQEDTAARSEFFEEATKALKSLRLAKLTVRSLQGSFGSGGRALVDSGATTSMRTARPNEVRGLPLRKVSLAEGETTFYQLPGGTLLTTKEVAPIVAMSDLMEIGCRVTWCSDEGCKVVHPVRGDLGARVINGCPEVDEQVGLELIAEAEQVKLRRREAELAVNRLVEGTEKLRLGAWKLDWEFGAKAVKDLRNGVGLSWAWLHQMFPEAPSWLVSAIPVVAGTDGDSVPWNRHERKRWRRASAVAVHLFCGRDRSTWKSRAEAAHVVTVDRAEDLMSDPTYAALLELALSGKVKTVFGGPPPRTFMAPGGVAGVGEGPRPLRDRDGKGRWGRDGLSEWETWRVKQDTVMIFRMVFLWMVATATARANGERDADFMLEHPEDSQEVLKDGGLPSLWAFPEIQFLKDEMKWFWWKFDQGPLGHPRRKPTRVLGSVQCPRELRDVRGPSTVSEEERGHDGDGFRSVTWADWAPGLKQAMKRVVEESLAGSALESIMKMDQSFLEHLQRDHMPFRRDCKACLAGHFRGHVHRRVVAPDAWTLSLDLVGPTRQGSDEYVRKIRYGLVGVLVVPDALGKILQPSDPDGEDEGAGVGLDPVCDEEAPEEGDGDAADSPVEKERSEREMAKWKARVDKEKLPCRRVGP